MEQLRDFWVRLALAVAIALPVYFLAAALGARLELFDWRFASETMTFRWGLWALIGVLTLAVVGVVLAFLVAPQRGRRIAILALLSPLMLFGVGYWYEQRQAQAAPIADVSTDLMDPPVFSQSVARARARLEGANGIDLLAEKAGDGRRVIDVQRAAYSDISSIPTGLAANQAFAMAEALAREQHWRINVADANAGVIEASAETLWFGFTDDIAVRVRPDGLGARIDMRASRRVGENDGGANARRVRAFMGELRKRLQEVES